MEFLSPGFNEPTELLREERVSSRETSQTDPLITAWSACIMMMMILMMKTKVVSVSPI